MIIYFTPGGRLGNQLFQYAKTISIARENETIIFGQMESFFKYFTLPNRKIIHIPNGYFLKILERTIIPILKIAFVNTRLFSSYIEEDNIEIYTQGIFKRIIWIDGYFQNPSIVTAELLLKFKLKDSYNTEAELFLKHHQIINDYIFAHIRRGDYFNFYVFNKKDPSLPELYYKNSLEVIQTSKRDNIIVLVGDEPSFLQQYLSDNNYQTIVSSLSPGGDFALMLKAAGGVISNSTFAWWAGKINGKKIAAPLYWLGWKTSQWYPQNIKDNSFIWIKVE